MAPKQKTVEKKITRQTTIGDIVQNYPTCIEPLLATGVHCVGCHVAHWETLEQGLRGHGFSEEKIDQVVKDLNEAIVENEDKDLMLTQKAADKIKELIKDKGNGFKGLRVKVVSGGCAGQSYELDYEKEAKDNDEVVEERGVKLFVDRESFDKLKGSQVDYVEALQGAGFKISNPNAKSSCGCGQSFS